MYAHDLDCYKLITKDVVFTIVQLVNIKLYSNLMFVSN